MKDKLLKIIRHFGIRHQLKKLNEECYELIEIVSEYNLYVEQDFDYGTGAYDWGRKKDHIKEELADNFVLLFQIMEYYQISRDEVETQMSKKIERTLERIESGYYDK